MDLRTLREKDIRTYSWGETLQVIQSLQKIDPLKFSKVYAMEESGNYIRFSSIIIERIENNDFDELNQGDQSQKDSFVGMLKKLMSDLNLSSSINRFVENKTVKMGELIGEQVKKQKEEIDLKVEEEKSKIEDLSRQIEKISDTEHNILSHVLTLMGIFSAVTTIIMSVVITSSSWLNSANEASAMLAFAVPNLVVLVSIVVLMLVLSLYNAIERIHRKEQVNVASTIVVGVVLVIIIALSVILVRTIFRRTSLNGKSHMRYAITPSEYNIVVGETGDTSCDNGDFRRYFEFNFDGVNHIFIYDEKCIHDGNLYYCSEHNQLE